MGKKPSRLIVEREDAGNYLLISLIAFAATVIVVRWFLELTGYPQVGNSTLHIAHVLWGGLLLFVAVLVALIWDNPSFMVVAAALSGIGMGLFIDEVGKFITQSNDYFFPAAAPIIYGFFLVTTSTPYRWAHALMAGRVFASPLCQLPFMPHFLKSSSVGSAGSMLA